jgi:endonuclease/exonuclease/phosphatase family metal-dependent hydrolase
MSGYVQCVLAAAETYRELISSSPCVLMGDLNSSVAYRSQCTAAFNHSALVALLKPMDLSRAYHGFFGEEQGLETRPTYYSRPQRNKPFHIDYCFLPESWAEQITHVEVGGFDDWKGLSDHRPLVVDIDINSKRAADPEAGGSVTVRRRCALAHALRQRNGSLDDLRVRG